MGGDGGACPIASHMAHEQQHDGSRRSTPWSPSRSSPITAGLAVALSVPGAPGVAGCVQDRSPDGRGGGEGSKGARFEDRATTTTSPH